MPLQAFRGPRVWLWRWRRNPLKRRADTVEAWVLLGACLGTVLAGVAAGLAAAGTVGHALARERAERRPAVARVTGQVPGPRAAASGTPAGDRGWATVRWTAPDGSAHTGQAWVAAGAPAGTPVTVWTDPQGRLVTRPASPAQARLGAGLVGGLVGVAAGGVPCLMGLALHGRLERYRMRQWDAEWARLGPQWRRTAG
ncbi:hypothetical protein ABZ922_38590 [Streptomyces shenzhenensis]|uniref:Rv1733c family protein n=1 Tax=Streptomyces shenzhenensis TaxID=943815 RepID=UPI0033CB520A